MSQTIRHRFLVTITNDENAGIKVFVNIKYYWVHQNKLAKRKTNVNVQH